MYFKEILNIDDYEMQKIIFQITDNNLIAATLSKSGKKVKNKFYSNMTNNRKNIINEIMNVKKYNKEEVRKYKKEIIETVENINYLNIRINK